VLQIVFPSEQTSDAAGKTQDNGSEASSAASELKSKSERKHKWYSLYDKVFAFQNLWDAWQKVKANNGAPGIDRVTVKRFDEDSFARITQLHTDLRDKKYRPQPVRRVFIPKSGGGQRPLGIPNVRDRIVQQALLQILEPIFDAKFSSRSHGFRPERGCATALEVVDRAVRHGYEWVVDADIKAFFDTVDHDTLIGAVNEEISDGSILQLIGRILEAGVTHPGINEIEPTELGTPQGGPISPLLANIYLHHFDVKMVEAGYGLVRYADDFVVFARSEEGAQAALNLARHILEDELSLTMHPEKTRVVSVASGFEFLGFHYFRDPKSDGMIKEVRLKSVHRFRDAIRQRTPRLIAQKPVKARHVGVRRLRKNKRVTDIIGKVNQYLRGWHGYFRTLWPLYPDNPLGSFDVFVRRRIRSSITGRTGSGWWNAAIPNRAFVQLGLVNLNDLQQRWCTRSLTAPARKGRLGGEPYAGKPHVRFGREGGR
jgi:group II intron reverse transcriptase/maturase